MLTDSRLEFKVMIVTQLQEHTSLRVAFSLAKGRRTGSQVATLAICQLGRGRVAYPRVPVAHEHDCARLATVERDISIYIGHGVRIQPLVSRSKVSGRVRKVHRRNPQVLVTCGAVHARPLCRKVLICRFVAGTRAQEGEKVEGTFAP